MSKRRFGGRRGRRWPVGIESGFGQYSIISASDINNRVKNDGTADKLTGGNGLDWFWGLAAEIRDLTSGERRN